MRRVFVVCEPTRGRGASLALAVDLTPAAKWGELRVVLTNTQSRISTVETVATIDSVLQDYCDQDYILPVGDPILMCAVAAVAFKRNNGRVRFLRWDRKNQDYHVVEVNLNN